MGTTPITLTAKNACFRASKTTFFSFCWNKTWENYYLFSDSYYIIFIDICSIYY